MRFSAGARIRALAGLTVLGGTLLPIQRDRVGRREQRTFHVLNGLPDHLYGPAWPVAAAAFPYLGARGRRVTLALAATVGLSRIYVGAHLPLDVAGGAALGLLVDGAWSLGRPPVG